MSFLAWLLIGAGFLGVILPILPASPLVAGGIFWLTYLRGFQGYSFLFWLGFVLLTGASLAADYVVLPVYVKHRGGSNAGSWAAGAGLLVGVFFGLPGIILGPFLGVLVVEFLVHKDRNRALKAAVNTIVGLFLSGVVKFTVLLAMVVWYWFF